MGSAIIKVFSFVCIILAGVIAARTGSLGKGADRLVSQIVFKLTLPCAVIHAFGTSDFRYDLLLVIPLGFICVAIPMLVSYLATLRSSDADRAFFLLNTGGMNIGCFALPFVQAIFPATYAVVTCMFDAGNSIIVTGGSYAITKTLLGQEHDEHPVRAIAKRLVSSIPFDCYMIMIALALAGIRIPEAVVQFTEPMSNANAFLAMFMLGLMVSVQIDSQKLGRLAKLLVIRYGFCAVATAVMLTLLPFDHLTRCVLATVLWAPLSAMAPMFTLWCGGDYGLSGLANAITILVGIVMMTAVMMATGVLV